MSGKLLLWTDIETTGLDEHRDAILEIGMLVTDWDLHTFDSGFHAVIKPGGWWWRKRRLSESVQDMHRANRLLRAVDAGDAVDTMVAIDAMNDYLNPYFADRGLLLAGSSVDFDRGFIKRMAPELFVWYRLGHRVLDVSVLDEIA
ncbi:exonuclease domain-containing protein, partial [Bifidobacterium psychraerophilum]|uniref:exonuclease domain-containing protein n=1 Tax=Bifidobacterium psychraerophilum TaxID=218140 RepID=UPI0033407E6F